MKPIRRLLPDPLIARLQQHHELHHVVRDALPPALREHVTLADVHGDRVTLQVAGHSWAQQLRFHQRELLKRLNAQPGVQVARLQIRVQPAPPVTPAAPPPEAGSRHRPYADCHQRLRALLARLED